LLAARRFGQDIRFAAVSPAGSPRRRSVVKKVVRIVGMVVLVLLVLAGGTFVWAYTTASRYYNQTWTSHEASFAIPFPLTADEVVALRRARAADGPGEPSTDLDVDAVARERAVASGKRLVETRYSCNQCHGPDFGGTKVIDSPVVGLYAAPNLTMGQGSVTLQFTARDWDRAVRHGIRHNGKTSSMPVTEFRAMSDHELSDVVSYIRSMPPVNRQMPPVALGPIFSFIVATDRDGTLGTFAIDHSKPHAVDPPALAASVALGQHIAQVCTGCHGPQFSGGKLAGDPSMPEVANLTPHETGIKDWTEADFLRAFHEGRRKDGTEIKPQMPWKTLGQMSDTELQAVWAFLRTLPPLEKGNH